MKTSLRTLAEKLNCRLIGDPMITVSTVSSLESASPESVIFVDHPKHLESALASPAAAIIVGEFANKDFATKAAAGTTPASPSRAKPLLLSTQPRLSFARAAKLLHPPAARARRIDPTAIVATSTIGSNVSIGPRAVVGEGVKIGDETIVATGVIIGDGVEIGRHCRIDSNVTIYSGTTLGDRVFVQAGAILGSEGFGYVLDAQTGRYEQFPQIGGLIIEDDVEIGANSTIDRGALDETRIRRGTKIDNLVHVGHNVEIGEDVVIAAQTGVSGSSVIESNVIVGGQVGIADHVRIEAGAILGAQSGIPTKKVIRGKGVVFWGTPARPIREYLKDLAFLSRAAKKEG
jgi:UDP-3-O-[3-hydroxymyristoyl] glucosamine N-acyltransferase